MDVTVPISELKKTLTVAKRVAAKRGALPALSGVRLDASGDTLTVQASDLDTTYTATLTAQVREPGSTIVGAADLANVIKGKGNVDLTTADTMLRAVNGTTSSLRTMPTEEWFRPTDFTDAKRYPVDLTTVAEIAAAASKDESRPILVGVLFRKNEIVATDSYRLHRATVVDVEYPKILIPAKAVLMAAKAGPVGVLEVVTLRTTHKVTRDNGKPKYLRDGRPSIYSFSPSVPNPAYKSWVEDVADSSTDVRIVVGHQTFGARLIEGDFPNYAQLIPSGYPSSVTVDRKRFIYVLEGVKPMAREATPVRLVVNDSVLTLTATTHDVGDSTGSLPCSVVGDFPVVAFNPEFLLACLTTLRGETVTLSATDSLKPALFREERGDGSTLRLLMPVRVS